jgi:SAM-dependent methyltransferase
VLAELERRLKLLPAPAKFAAKRAAPLIDPVLRRRYRRETADPRPLPPMVLRARVGAGIRIDAYVGEGARLARELEAALGAQRTSLRERRVVYDWGCGCGRLLMHLDGLVGPDTQVIGSDVDAEAVAWAARAWPHMRLLVTGFKPPLPLEGGSVDCLVSSSILTHLTEADQDLWLAELRRILAPDGYALITVAGPAAFKHTLTGESATRSSEFGTRLAALPPLEEHGFLFEPYTRGRWDQADFKGVTDVYGATFHHPDYVREHWAPWFDLVDMRPASVNSLQDLLVLRPA